MEQLILQTKIFSGENIVAEFDYSDYSRVLIVTDQIMDKIGLTKAIIQRLESQNIDYHVFKDVEANPSYNTVIKGVMEVIQFTPDAILAIGGGSVIDAAKGFVYYSEATYKHLEKKFRKPALIAVPTTSGSGSEVTSYAVITDTERQIKIPISSEIITPDIALLDPIVTRTCPPKVTAESGIDVLTHALESYVSTQSNIFTETLSEKVCYTVFNKLITAFQQGDDLSARQLMHEASCMAGIAFTNSGLGLNHAMSHSLGGLFHIPHGRANAMLITHVIKFNQQVSARQYMKIANVLGFPSSTEEEAISGLIIGIEYLCKTLQLERSVLEFGISKDDFLAAIPELAMSAFNDPCVQTNPIKPTLSQIEEIYKNLI